VQRKNRLEPVLKRTISARDIYFFGCPSNEQDARISIARFVLSERISSLILISLISSNSYHINFFYEKLLAGIRDKVDAAAFRTGQIIKAFMRIDRKNFIAGPANTS